MQSPALIGDVIQHGQVVLAADGSTPPASVLSDLDAWSLIFGAITPFIVAFISQSRWSPIIKSVLTVVVSLVVGGITAALQGDLTAGRWAHSALVVGVAA